MISCSIVSSEDERSNTTKSLHRARSRQDLRLPAGNRLEALKGDRAGAFSVRVNDQYRLTFRWEKGDAYDVTCEDYH